MKRLYVLVRKDLHPIYACVQGGHAVAEFAINHPGAFKEWMNGYLIYLNGGAYRSMLGWLDKLTLEYPDLSWSVFKEPDLDGQITAIAVYCDGRIFERVRTL